MEENHRGGYDLGVTKPGMYVSPIRLICVSCERDLPGNDFRGARFKAAACRDCEQQHPDERWCIDCVAWLPADDFYRVGAKQEFMTNRCKPCRVHNFHGVTREFMAQLTGSNPPACAACGETGARLSIDHDHNHCPGERGCEHCVRGYLCQPCNTAEGLLRTSDRARALADYIDRTALSAESLASLPISNRTGVKRDRRVPGANRKYYEHK